MSERGADQRGFLIIEFLSQASFGPPTGFLSLGFIDMFRADGHVGHESDAIAGDFDEALSHSQEIVTTVLSHHNFASNDLRHQRHVLWEDTHLAFHSRESDHLDVLGVRPRLRRDNFQF